MKQKDLRIISLVLFSIGLSLIISSNTDLLGAVVGISATSISSIPLGILLIMFSGILFVAGTEEDKDLESIVSAGRYRNRFEVLEPDSKKRSIIIDASSILDYSAKEVEGMLEGEKDVVVPRSVLREVRNPALRRVIQRYGRDISDNYRKIAKTYVEEGKKHRFYEQVIPIIMREKEPPKSHREAFPSKEECKKILNNLSKRHLQVTRENLVREIERHYRVSDADVDVVANALYKARHKKHAVVLERDIDIKEAISKIKKEHPKIGKYIDYAEPYTT